MTPDTITAPQSLREHFGEPLHIAVAVEKPQLDEHHRRFIEHSPFICIASRRRRRPACRIAER